jgi:hypothetical protein
VRVTGDISTELEVGVLGGFGPAAEGEESETFDRDSEDGAAFMLT